MEEAIEDCRRLFWCRESVPMYHHENKLTSECNLETVCLPARVRKEEIMTWRGDDDVFLCLNIILAHSLPNFYINYRKVSRQYVFLHYFSKRGKAAVKITEESGDTVIPRRGSGILRGVHVSCEALLSPGAMSHIKDISYSNATAFWGSCSLFVLLPSESPWYSLVNEDHMSKVMLMSTGQLILHCRKIQVFCKTAWVLRHSQFKSKMCYWL